MIAKPAPLVPFGVVARRGGNIPELNVIGHEDDAPFCYAAPDNSWQAVKDDTPIEEEIEEWLYQPDDNWLVQQEATDSILKVEMWLNIQRPSARGKLRTESRKSRVSPYRRN